MNLKTLLLNIAPKKKSDFESIKLIVKVKVKVISFSAKNLPQYYFDSKKFQIKSFKSW